MSKKLALFQNFESILATLEKIDESIKIILGPTGKTALLLNEKSEIKFLNNGSLLIKSLEETNTEGNLIIKLLEQVSLKTANLSGDGSKTTILISCDLLKGSLKLLINGYNGIFLSNGFKKIALFFFEKVLESSKPISNIVDLQGILKTSLGRKGNSELSDNLQIAINEIGRDGLLIVEENSLPNTEIDIVQGIELDRGFASSYFVNNLKNFEINYENPYILVASEPITSLNQLKEILDYIKITKKPLIIVAEEITKEIISTLVLNTIQKKLKVAVVKYSSIKFLKIGILEDLALLTHSTYFPNPSNKVKIIRNYFKEDLGQAIKVLITKDKSTFFISKFSKVISKRRINELNRELLVSETEYEKSIFKTRIARLSGRITKIKIGNSNQYQIQEERQKIENLILTFKSSLEEGILPGGGAFYLSLLDDLKQWSYLNLIGDEIFSSQITSKALYRPFQELCENTNHFHYSIIKEIQKHGYPYAFDFIDKKSLDTLKYGLVDSSKSVRCILWNSLRLIASVILSD